MTYSRLACLVLDHHIGLLLEGRIVVVRPKCDKLPPYSSTKRIQSDRVFAHVDIPVKVGTAQPLTLVRLERTISFWKAISMTKSLSHTGRPTGMHTYRLCTCRRLLASGKRRSTGGGHRIWLLPSRYHDLDLFELPRPRTRGFGCFSR